MIISTASIGCEQHKPTVSVVIPAFNAARYIQDALDSLQAQIFNDYEVIVVNDGSHDAGELERIIHSHPLPIIYLSQENRGVSAARNAAIKIARGEFYAQLDADDQWAPEYLEVQVGLLLGNPGVALVYPNATIIVDDSDVTLEFMSVCPSEGEVTFETLIRQQCIVMTCVTARMNAIKEAGTFDEMLRSCEDFDLWLRIIRKGGRIIYHRRILARYRRHAGSLSSDRVWMMRNLLEVFEKTARTPDLTPSESEILKEEIACSRASLRLFEGKQALATGDTRKALVHFEKANQNMRGAKLTLVNFLLRHFPRTVAAAYAARERLMGKLPKYRLTGIDEPRKVFQKELSDSNASQETQ